MVSRRIKGVIMGVMVVTSYPTFAVSEDECSIWMCAPTGFSDSSCKGAKDAFKKRVRRHKPPLPDFASCMVHKDQIPEGTPISQMTYINGVSAVIRETKECVSWDGTNSNNRHCSSWKTIPEHLIKGVACTKNRHGGETPKNCISTVKWVETYMDGQLLGDIFYYR
ncbi:hypothetical protein [Aliivibrio fischeri]